MNLKLISIIKKAFLFSIVLVVFSCEKKQTVTQTPAIIPTPLEQNFSQGVFTWDDNVGFEFTNKSLPVANLLESYVGKPNANGTKKVRFVLSDDVSSEEGYHLNVTEKEIVITSKTNKGGFHAVQTLRQLLPPCIENNSCGDTQIGIQAIAIKDEPAFKYRGMHLDVGRHMFPVDFIKKYIDRMALLKYNTFHWHLTEDQGWRIEIKKYPKLQEVAAYRKETLIDHYNTQPQKFDGKRYGGYYTQEEVKEVVAYATARGITVIPEIEMPGHSQAAIAAYPELGCTGEQIEVATKWGVFEDIYCPKEETFKFLEDVLDEVMELFPSKYIHIGGDEAPKARWKNSKFCQDLIKREGLKDEHGLQNYFITRMEKYLNSKGRQIIGWDEILEGGLAPNATVMSWRGTKGAIDAAKQHHNVILTPGTHCYFDHYQSDNPQEPIAIGGFTPLEKVYDFDPIPQELTKEEAKYVLGGQANVWTEYMKTEEKVEYMVFPRILAMSEVLWTYKKRPDYDNFVKRLVVFQDRMDNLEINYADHLHELKGEVSGSKDVVKYSLSKKAETGNIHYTTDGSAPTLESKVYKEPITFDKDQHIKAVVYKDTMLKGYLFEQKLTHHKALQSKVTVSHVPHKNYDTGGKEALVNGLNGSSKRFGDKEWLGWRDGKQLTITIELEKAADIKTIQTRFFNANGQWIYAPKQVKIKFNDKEAKVFDLESSKDLIVDFSPTFDEKQVTKIELTIEPYGIIPDGQQGAGHNGWLFIDELIIK